MKKTQPLLDAIFDLSMEIHCCRNSANYRAAEKTQLGSLFDALTSRSTLMKLAENEIDDRPDADFAPLLGQLETSQALLAEAKLKSDRREAIAEAFEVLELLDAVLPTDSNEH